MKKKYAFAIRGIHQSWHRTEGGLIKAARLHIRASRGTLLWYTLRRYGDDGQLQSIGHLDVDGSIEWYAVEEV